MADFPDEAKVKELQALAAQKREDKLKAAEELERLKLEEERKANAPPEPPKPLELEDLGDDVDELKKKVVELSKELEQMKDKYLNVENENTLGSKIIKADGIYGSDGELPGWIDLHCNSLESVALDDSFVSDEYRQVERFKGKDFLHTPTMSSPLITESRLTEPPDFQNSALWPKVESVVMFTPNSEQAKSWVHRGALCALMDDAANWAGFCVSGVCDRFCGFTKHVDVSLKRPVRVGSVLKLIGETMEIKNRTDCHVKCKLIDPAYNDNVHCEADCIFVMNERAAERVEELVARKQKKRGNSGGTSQRGFNTDMPLEMNSGFGEGETISDPAFRPPNRVGRYGLGMKIDDETAQKIDVQKARTFVPKSGSLVKNAQISAIKREKERQRAEAERLEFEKEQNRRSGRIKHGWENPFGR